MMIVGLPASPSIVWYQTPAIVGKRPIDPTLPNAHTGPGPTLQRRQCSIYALANDEPTANELPLAKTNLSRSIWTIDHIYPVAARGFLDHLRRCPSDFDILTVGSFAGNTPVGDAETDVAVFVDMAHGQLDGQLQCQEAHECLFNIRKSVNRLPRLSDEYALVIVQLQQAVHVARVESLLKGRINVQRPSWAATHPWRETLRTRPLQQKGRYQEGEFGGSFVPPVG